MNVGIAMRTAAMMRQRICFCSLACRRRERSWIDGLFSNDGLNPGDSSALKMVRMVVFGGDGL